MLAEALCDIAAALNGSLNLAEVLDRIFSNVGHVVPHDAPNIMLLGRNQTYITIVRANGYLAAEPTANLDSKIGHGVMRLLRQIAKEQNRRLMIVSHDQRIKDIADRVLWLEDGQFKEIVSMVIDPVCGMPVEQEKAIGTEWNGQLKRAR